jgi:hypothetical protein
MGMARKESSSDSIVDVSTLGVAVHGLLKKEPNQSDFVEKLTYTLQVADETIFKMAPQLVTDARTGTRMPTLSAMLENVYKTRPIEEELKERGIDTRSRHAVCDRHEVYFVMLRECGRIKEGLTHEYNFAAVIGATKQDFAGRHAIPGSQLEKEFPNLTDAVLSMRMAGTMRAFVEKKLKPLTEGSLSDHEVMAQLQNTWGEMKSTYPDIKQMRFFKDMDEEIQRGSNDARALVGEVSKTLTDSATHIETRGKPETLLASYKRDVEKGAKPERLTELAPNTAKAVRGLYAQETFASLFKMLESNEPSIVRALDAHAVDIQRTEKS